MEVGSLCWLNGREATIDVEVGSLLTEWKGGDHPRGDGESADRMERRRPFTWRWGVCWPNGREATIHVEVGSLLAEWKGGDHSPGGGESAGPIEGRRPFSRWAWMLTE